MACYVSSLTKPTTPKIGTIQRPDGSFTIPGAEIGAKFNISAEQAAVEFMHIETSTINLGVMCTLSSKSLLQIVRGWQKGRSGGELLIHDLLETNVSIFQNLLLVGAVDCAIFASLESLPERFNAISLMEEPMVLAMSRAHPLCEKPAIIVNDLAKLDYVDRLRCEYRSFFIMGSRIMVSLSRQYCDRRVKIGQYRLSPVGLG